MAPTLVCVLVADAPVPTFHRIGKGKIADDGVPSVLTFCGRRNLAGEWPARIRLDHARTIGKPCLTCWPDRVTPLE